MIAVLVAAAAAGAAHAQVSVECAQIWQRGPIPRDQPTPGSALVASAYSTPLGEPRRPVFSLTFSPGRDDEYGSVANEQQRKPDAPTGDVRNATIVLADNEAEFYAARSNRFRASFGPFGWAKAKLKTSMSLRLIREQRRIYSRAFFECSPYKLYPLEGAALDPVFVAAVQALPTSFGLSTRATFFDFLEDFGDSYFSEAEIGATLEKTAFTSRRYLELVADARAQLRVDVGFSILIDVSVGVDFGAEVTAEYTAETLSQSIETMGGGPFEPGVTDPLDWWLDALTTDPVIIGGTLAGIDELLTGDLAPWRAAVSEARDAFLRRPGCRDVLAANFNNTVSEGDLSRCLFAQRLLGDRFVVAAAATPVATGIPASEAFCFLDTVTPLNGQPACEVYVESNGLWYVNGPGPLEDGREACAARCAALDVEYVPADGGATEFDELLRQSKLSIGSRLYTQPGPLVPATRGAFCFVQAALRNEATCAVRLDTDGSGEPDAADWWTLEAPEGDDTACAVVCAEMVA